MDAPVVELPRGFRKGIECGRRPQEYAFQPRGERLDGFGRSAGLSVDLDDVGGVARTVILGETGHSALFQLFDPLDLSLKAIANVDGEPGIFGVKDVSLGASLKGVGVSFDEVLELVDSGVELPYFGCVIIFSLFNCLEQGFGDPLQGIRVEVGAAVKDVSSRSG